MTQVTADLLARLGVREPMPWVGPMNAACLIAGITTPKRLAPFLGIGLHETGDLSVLVESMDYDAGSLVRQWPSHFTPAVAAAVGRAGLHPANQVRIAEIAYGGRYGNFLPGRGDGWLFRGHGMFQTTFRSNYVALKKTISWQGPVEALPAYLVTIEGACRSASAWWAQAGCNAMADAGQWTKLRERANGGTIGLQDALRRCHDVAVLIGCPIPAETLQQAVPAADDSAVTAALNDASAKAHA